MPVEYLIILTYGTAIMFLMALTLAISAVTLLRRIRLEKQQIAAASHPEAIRQKLYLVHSPLDTMQTWNNNPKRAKVRDTATITQLPTQPPAVPVRYQQITRYPEKSYDLNNDIETKPSIQPYQPAIPRTS